MMTVDVRVRAGPYVGIAESLLGATTMNSQGLVNSDLEILGGTPVFVGTRVPIAVLFENLADGMSLDEILDAYPTLKRDQAIAALRQAESLLELEKAV